MEIIIQALAQTVHYKLHQELKFIHIKKAEHIKNNFIYLIWNVQSNGKNYESA
jgi:hypothetical protein